jgi:hypothetical protein
VAGSCEHGNEPSRLIIGGDFFSVVRGGPASMSWGSSVSNSV